MKNGHYFLNFVNSNKDIAIWDPYHYREASTNLLGEFVHAQGISSRKGETVFEPITYKDIPKMNYYFSYGLKMLNEQKEISATAVEEEKIIFGTMRAYLGNVILTPKTSWLNCEEKLLFPVKSEFINIIPEDGLIYFWFHFLRSESFLKLLPLGSGGTRPRLQGDSLLKTPIKVTDLPNRKKINDLIRATAKNEWLDYNKRIKLIKRIETNNGHQENNNGRTTRLKGGT